MQARSRLACHTLCRNGDVSLLTQALTLIRNRILSILGYRRRRFNKSLVSFCPLPLLPENNCPLYLPTNTGPVLGTYSRAGRGSCAAIRLEVWKSTSAQLTARAPVHRSRRSPSPLLSPSTPAGFPCSWKWHPTPRETRRALRQAQTHTSRASKVLE